MPKVLRDTVLSARDLLVTAGPFVFITLVLLALASIALDPTPPRKVVLATGPAHSLAFAAMATRSMQPQLTVQHGHVRVVDGANSVEIVPRRLFAPESAR